MLNNWFKNSAAGKTILVLVLVCMIFTSVFPSYVEAVGALGLGATVGGGIVAVGATAAAFGATIAATPLLIAGAVVGGIVAGIAWYLSPKDCEDWFSARCLAHVYTSLINVFIQIAGVTAVLMGQMFDTTLKLGLETYTIFAKNSVMTQLWGTIRDLVNLCFIFILLYAAVRTMLGLSTSPMKLVFNILIAALLVNFSFAITRTVIDASNVSTATFYNILTHDGTEPVSKLILQAISIDDLVNYDGISYMGKTPLAGGATADNLGARALGVINSSFFSAGYATLCLLFIFAINVLFIAFSIMLMIRTVVLILLILGSPVAFLAFAMPDSMHGLFKTWATYLLKQAFWLPIMLLLLVLGLIISAQLHNGLIEAMKIMAGKLDTATANQLLVLYIIGNSLTMAFLLLPLIVAKSMGVAGADFAMKWGQKAMLFGGGVATGIIGAGARWAKIPEAVEKLPGGAYLRNLPRYGRDIISGTADSIGAASGLSSILPTSAAMKEPSIFKRFEGYNKSLDAERKAESKERMEAGKKDEVKKAESRLMTLSKDFLSDSEIDSSTTDPAKRADLRARRADSQQEVATIMGRLGSNGRQALDQGVKESKAGKHGLTSDDLKKMFETENFSDEARREFILEKALTDAKGAAGAASNDDLRTMNLSQLQRLRPGMSSEQNEEVLTKRSDLFGEAGAGLGGFTRNPDGTIKMDRVKQWNDFARGLKPSQLGKIPPAIIIPHAHTLLERVHPTTGAVVARDQFAKLGALVGTPDKGLQAALKPEFQQLWTAWTTAGGPAELKLNVTGPAGTPIPNPALMALRDSPDENERAKYLLRMHFETKSVRSKWGLT